MRAEDQKQEYSWKGLIVLIELELFSSDSQALLC